MRAIEDLDDAFGFGPYLFVPGRQLLLRDQRPLKLGARALDILHLLLIRAGEVVSKEELISFTWPSTVVDQANLKVHVSALRRVLRETTPQPTYIATVTGRGYRFVAPVSSEGCGSSVPMSAVGSTHETLPSRRTIIGREREVVEAGRALDDAATVTLVGPGGVGKTTVAIEVAHRKSGEFRDGVRFVDLSCIGDASLVPHVLANALGIRQASRDVSSAVVEHMACRRILVLLDNCEHVLPAVVLLTAALREAGASARVLATSREPIGAPAEVIQRIEPFACPEEGETGSHALSYPSLALFALRAHESAAYVMVEEDIPAVARMCALTDGLPLAIELVAARLERATPAELLRSVEGLSDQAFVEGRDEIAAPLWAAFDWSFRLLSEQDATTYRLLSVFAGGFDMTDLVAMTRLVGHDPYQTTVTLGRLVAKSLVSASVEGNLIEYRLLECSRWYAAQMLVRDPVLRRRVHDEHARLLRTIFEKAEDEWHRLEVRTWRRRYERRLADLRQALDWCFGPGADPALGIELTASAIRIWNEQSSIFEQMTQVERALASMPSTPDQASRRAKLATSHAWSLTLAGKLWPEADAAWRSALDVSERGVEPGVRVSAMSGSATYLVYTGRCAQAVERLRECAAVADQSGSATAAFESRRRTAFAELHFGALTSALRGSESLAGELDTGLRPSSISRYREERYVGVQSTLALASWLTGASDRAISLVADMLDRTGGSRQRLGHSHILALVALPIALWRRDMGSLEDGTAALRRNLETSNIAIWAGVCRFYEAATHHAAGRGDAVLEMEDAIDDLVGKRLLIRTPTYLGLLAEAQLSRHAVGDAEKSVRRAFDHLADSGERWCLPELLRVRARIAVERFDAHGARDSLLQAQVAAEQTGARFLQLRAAVDLAGLTVAGGQRAMDSLRAIAGTFEGQGAFPDLSRARRLLGAVSPD